MYWPGPADFSGVCACERKSTGAETKNKSRNNRRVILIRRKILTLTIGVVVAQHAARPRGRATSFLLPDLPAARRRRRRSHPLRAAASGLPVWNAPLREFHWRARE